jgi:riboflavin kinase/FMN adenylyltransferase
MTEFRVFHSLADVAGQLKNPVVTIGNFDGVHRGHQAIFARVRELADERADNDGAEAVALSFSPHPVRFFRPDIPPFQLTTDEQKARLMERYGLDAVVLLPFNAALAGLSPQQFVQQVLRDGLNARFVVVGQGFVFGKGRSGGTEDLKALGAAEGIGVEIAGNVGSGEDAISSTRVRKALSRGDLAEIARLLGRPYRIGGAVVSGDKRGRELGFPTANIDSPNPLLPPNGIYVSRLHVPRLGSLRSLTSVGTRPTFSGEDVRVETFVLAGEAEVSELDLYDEQVELDFLEFLRPEEKFDSADALIARMHADVAEALEYFER